MSRAEARARGAERVDALDRALRARGAWIAPDVTAAAALHGHLVGVAADLLEATQRPATWARGARVLRDRWAARLRSPTLDPPGTTRVALLVPRRPSHLRALIPLAERMRDTGAFDPRWLVFRTDDAATLRARGFTTIDAPALGARRLRPELRAWAAWARVLRRGRADAVDRAILQELAVQLPAVVLAAEAARLAVAGLRPRAVVLGNPYTAEGVVTGAWARAAGIPVVTVQHGDIAPGQLEWRRARFDRVCVWGETARDTLTTLGVPSERVAITGAPWSAVDATQQDRPRRRVLVALSGAGHVVGLPEHESHIRAVDGASRALPQTDWRVRLHPKDEPALWRRLCPNARFELVQTDQAGPIDADLRSTDVLLTVTSTAGIDASRHGVDVITFERASGERVPAYVDAGATTRTPVGELTRTVDDVLRRGAAPEVRAAAVAFLDRTLGPRDERVAERMLDVVESVANDSCR